MALRPRSEAKRNALHTAVHALPKSRDLSTIIEDLDDSQKTVERYEICGGTVTDADKRTVLLKKLPPGVSSDLLSALRKCSTYNEMKDELEDQVTFLQDYGGVAPSRAAQGAHVVDAGELEADSGDADMPVLEVDAEELGEESVQHILLAAQKGGYRVKFRGKPGFQSKPRGPPNSGGGRATTPPRTGAAAPLPRRCANCGGLHATA